MSFGILTIVYTNIDFIINSCKSRPNRISQCTCSFAMVKTPAPKVASAGSAKAAAAPPKHLKKDGAKEVKRTKHKPNFKERRKLKALKQAGGSKPAVPASAATPGKGKKPTDSKSAKDLSEPVPSETKAETKAASPVAASASSAQKKATPKKPQTPASSRRPKA